MRLTSRAALACITVLVLLPAALLWPSLCGREVFLPFSAASFPPFSYELSEAERHALTLGQNLDITEVTVTFCPEWQFARSELAAGRLPHWNPYARFGASLLATSVVGMLYPPNWLTFLALDPEHGLAWNAYATLVAAGLLMLGFLRALGLGWVAALFGAVGFAWSGTLSANLHFYQRMHALVWLPGILWALLAMRHGDGRRRQLAGVALSLALAMSWLAGFPAYAAAVTLVAAGHASWLAAGCARAEGWRPARRLALAMAVAAGLGLLLACVQLLPMFAFFPESNRNPDPGADDIASQAFAPMGFLGYALPHAFGSPTSDGPPYPCSLLAWWLFDRASWDTGIPFASNYNYIEYTVFPGTLTLVLAAFGLGAGRGRARAFPVLAVVALWALAVAGPWLAPVNSLPFVRSVPPMRFVGPACALLAWLAALGVDRVLHTPVRRTCWVLLAACLAVATACLLARTRLAAFTPDAWLEHLTPDLVQHYRPRFPNATPEVVRGLFGAHAGAAHRQLLANLDYGAVAFTVAALWLAALGWARQHPVRRRVLVALALLATAAELFLLAWPINRGRPAVPLSAPALTLLRQERDAHRDAGGFGVIRATTSADALPRALPPGLLVPERIRDLNAYTFVDARSHRLFRALYGADAMIRTYWPPAFADDARLQLPLWDALGVRYVLATTPLQHAGELLPAATGAGPFYVYERRSAMPRAFVVPALREVTDEDAVIAAMTAAGFAPGAEVVVTPGPAAALRAAPAAAGAGDRAVTFRVDLPTTIVLDVAPGPPGFLVLSDALMHGWTATVGGEEVPIERGNLFMRVVPVPAGAVEVRLRFTTPRLRLGALVSLAALVMILWLWRRRPPAPSASPPHTAPPP